MLTGPYFCVVLGKILFLMRKIELFEKSLETDSLDSLPFFANWNQSPEFKKGVIRQANTWYVWKLDRRWWNILNIGEPDITGWNLYITHIYEFADALGLSFSEVIRLKYSSLQEIARARAATHIDEALNAFLRHSHWIVNGEYKRYKLIISTARRFRLLEQVVLHETYEEFVGQYVCPKSVRI